MQIIEQAGPTRNEDTMMGTIHPWSGEAGWKNGAGPLKRVIKCLYLFTSPRQIVLDQYRILSRAGPRRARTYPMDESRPGTVHSR